MKLIELIPLMAALLFLSGCTQPTDASAPKEGVDSGVTPAETLPSGETNETPPDAEGATVETGMPVEEGTEETVVVEEPQAGGYTLAEVAEHASADDCWIVFDGKVYDLTAFVSGHPGGNSILEGCGTDATELFETRPMGSGTPHSEGARNRRDDYYLGELS